jgi:hypothetical protein
MASPTLLTDAEALYRQLGEPIRYPLGAAFVDGFVTRYGQAAPKKLLATLADPGFPRSLKGLAAWQAAFQLAGYDLPLVLDDYARMLADWEETYAENLALLPRARGELWREGGWVGIQVRLDRDLPEGWWCLVRFRPSEESPLEDYVTRAVNVGDIAWQELTRVEGERVCFQVGISGGKEGLYEPWQCLPLSSAAEHKSDSE